MPANVAPATTDAIAVEFSFAGLDLTITAVCTCGNPISRSDLRIENYGTDSEPCFESVACCSGDENADTPDEIDLDKVWEFHVRLGIQQAQSSLTNRIENMNRIFQEAAQRFREDNDPSPRARWTPEDVI